MCWKTANKGFTLIELMTVVAIIAILASFLFPRIAQYRISARRTRCIATMQQIRNAVESRRIAVGNAAVETSWGPAYVDENGHSYFRSTPHCPELSKDEPYDISSATESTWEPCCKKTDEPYLHIIRD